MEVQEERIGEILGGAIGRCGARDGLGGNVSHVVCVGTGHCCIQADAGS